MNAFQSVYTKTLRDMRWGIVGWGVGIGVLVIATGYGWATAYPDTASRQQLTTQIHGGLSAAQVFYGPPGDLDVLGGFLEWRVLGLAPVLLGLYLILAATGMTRGAEADFRAEIIVATPVGRSKLLTQQAAALATGLILILAIVAVAIATAGPVAAESGPTLAEIAGCVLNLGAVVLFFGAVSLLAAQLTVRRRSAALVSGAIMAVAHLSNTLPLVVTALRGLRYISPLYLYSRSTALSNGHIDFAALGALFLCTAAVSALALFASARRDMFDTWHRRRAVLTVAELDIATNGSGPVHEDLFLRAPFGRGLRDAVGTAIGWAIGLASMAALFTALTPNIRESLLKLSGPFARQLERAGLTSEKAILGILLFSFLPPLATLIGVMIGASWAGDELGQRLELELCVPVPRWRFFVERWLAAVAAIAAVLLATMLSMVLTIEISGVNVPIAGLVGAMWTLLILAACVAAVTFAVASTRPGLTTAGAGGFVAIAYFWGLVVPLFGWPHWVSYLSVFGLYGSPLNDGVIYWQVAVLAALTGALVAVGAMSFSRRDIVK